MSEIHYPTMELEASTFHCPTCNCEIAAANQLTHEVACARMQRNNNNNDQRAPAPQPIVRQSSSSALPDPQPRAQPLPRREDRRIVENKLVTCPNCEKSVREQDINSHMDNECLKNELIPCEFCDEAIAMDSYGQHVEGCQRRAQRDRSPVRERPSENNVMQEEHEEDFEDVHEEESPIERDRSPERGSSQEAQGASQGGIRGFFRNLADTASHAYRSYNEQLQREAEEREQRREAEERRQREFLEHMFGQPQVPRNQMSNQNALVPYRRPNNGGNRVIRTVERGPGGTIIVRSRVVPSEEPQMFPGMSGHPLLRNNNRGMGGMDPMAMLINMMNGNMGGMNAIENGGEMQAPPEQTGLDKETLDSLATMKYNKETNKNLDEELKKCPICLDEFEDGQEVKFLWCTHRFHKDCVDKWLDGHTNCPICKKDFSEAEQGFSP